MSVFSFLLDQNRYPWLREPQATLETAGTDKSSQSRAQSDSNPITGDLTPEGYRIGREALIAKRLAMEGTMLLDRDTGWPLNVHRSILPNRSGPGANLSKGELQRRNFLELSGHYRWGSDQYILEGGICWVCGAHLMQVRFGYCATSSIEQMYGFLKLYRMFACPNRESPLHILVMRYRHRLLRADAEEREARSECRDIAWRLEGRSPGSKCHHDDDWSASIDERLRAKPLTRRHQLAIARSERATVQYQAASSQAAKEFKRRRLDLGQP